MNKEKLNEILNDKNKTFTVIRDQSAKLVDKKFIKDLRSKFGYTQIVFASIIGVSVKTIEKWEQGSIEPRTMNKKLLYLLDKYPKLINDLYSYHSHESTDYTYYNEGFEQFFSKNSHTIKLITQKNKPFERIGSTYTPEFNKTSNSGFDNYKTCCPAS